jgi:hypothetical protein
MKSIDLMTMLPSTSFVAIECSRLSHPVVAWDNSDSLMNMDLGSHFFCKPAAGESPSTYTDERKVYYAERYGGASIGGNGGGGRCGLAENVQIKGIGKSAVIGIHTDYWHSHGAASLEEGVREALWGEICHMTLPFGGVRIHGLITTGTQIPYDHAQKGHSLAPRALIVRQQSLRPAHFMRAIYFTPDIGVYGNRTGDTLRTRRAIECMGRAFAQSFELTQGTTIESVNEGLMQMVVRFARQVATARAKRIMHGLLSCSNISLDGRWIDYGTMTTISDYGRIIVARHGNDFCNEALPLINTIRDLLFYLRKYLPARDVQQLHTVDALIEVFESSRRRQFSYESAKLIGIPKKFLINSTNDFNGIVDDLSKCFEDIIGFGKKEPFKLSPSHVSQMPETMGVLHLNQLIRAVSVFDDLSEMDAAVRQKIVDASLRERFCRGIWTIRHSVVRDFTNEDKRSMRLAMMFNALRLNAPFSDLYRPNLDKALSEVTLDAAGVSTLIGEIMKKTRTFLVDFEGLNVDLYGLINKEKLKKLTAFDCASQQISVEKYVDIVRSIDQNYCPCELIEKADKYVRKLFSGI